MFEDKGNFYYTGTAALTDFHVHENQMINTIATTSSEAKNR